METVERAKQEKGVSIYIGEEERQLSIWKYDWLREEIQNTNSPNIRLANGKIQITDKERYLWKREGEPCVQRESWS